LDTVELEVSVFVKTWIGN